MEWLKKLLGMDKKAAAPAPEVKPEEVASPVEVAEASMTGGEEVVEEAVEETPAETASEELK
jgi:hypothetical protein